MSLCEHCNDLEKKLELAAYYAGDGASETATAVALLAVLGLKDGAKERMAVLDVLPDIKRMVESRHTPPRKERRRARR